jgi:hypothetical protein
MVIKLAGAADIASEQRYFNIETVGNTSGASIPGPEVGAAEVGAAEVGAAEVGAAEVGAAEVGAAEVGAAAVGAGEVRLGQLDFPQIRIRQVGPPGWGEATEHGDRCLHVKRQWKLVHVFLGPTPLLHRRFWFFSPERGKVMPEPVDGMAVDPNEGAQHLDDRHPGLTLRLGGELLECVDAPETDVERGVAELLDRL